MGHELEALISALQKASWEVIDLVFIQGNSYGETARRFECRSARFASAVSWKTGGGGAVHRRELLEVEDKKLGDRRTSR